MTNEVEGDWLEKEIPTLKHISLLLTSVEVAKKLYFFKIKQEQKVTKHSKKFWS